GRGLFCVNCCCGRGLFCTNCCCGSGLFCVNCCCGRGLLFCVNCCCVPQPPPPHGLAGAPPQPPPAPPHPPCVNGESFPCHQYWPDTLFGGWTQPCEEHPPQPPPPQACGFTRICWTDCPPQPPPQPLLVPRDGLYPYTRLTNMHSKNTR
ncbi:unnamed protein product, partial [Meganyctiphanes norvegica]